MPVSDLDKLIEQAEAIRRECAQGTLPPGNPQERLYDQAWNRANLLVRTLEQIER